MPKLSSAETPPAKSSAVLPVSTIALSGVITRMPLVCINIVASAFQYGCAPTFMPVTMTLISPPCCVNSMIRRSAAATQSMFSVPESIAIFAPDESANHSTGTPSSSAMSSAAMMRRHSGSATEPSAFVGSPSSTTRCWHAELLGHVERGHDAPALGLGDGAERLRRVAQQHDALHAVGMALGERAHEPDDDRGVVG